MQQQQRRPLAANAGKRWPDEVLIDSEAYPGDRSARSGMRRSFRCFKLCLPLPLEIQV